MKIRKYKSNRVFKDTKVSSKRRVVRSLEIAIKDNDIIVNNGIELSPKNNEPLYSLIFYTDTEL